MATSLIQKIVSPFMGRANDFDLDELLKLRRNAVRDRKYMMFGRVQTIRFDVSSEAPYESMRKPTDDQRVEKRQRMLFFDWSMETAPLLGQAGKEFVFPVGIQNPPRQAVGGINQIVNEENPPVYVDQDLLDHADGYVEANWGNDSFAVIHPVIAFVTLAQGAFVLYRGYPDMYGRRPALLYNPVTKEAHFAGGQLLPDKST
jgi:hypothetical protein